MLPPESEEAYVAIGETLAIIYLWKGCHIMSQITSP